ncbi:ABC-F family ATP-binding cassette domain-containing protein [Desulfopila sp. IMCC35008]|uniref:ABC-F family ATP-binding cassette domain-containing protein n=1 Tax=Desulfopila sp. IMCC35008 TaxID=2653858 RepID=UPI0013D7C985|nr:ABC-F family ATP-binding cassette domain-containing protein [Desulfopila sp. IMCC35008]
MLSVNHLDIRYGDKHLFKDVSVQVYEGNKIGLVGVNGAGKSTLLKIMAGVAATDDGVVNKAKSVTVGYLPQESNELLTGKTLYEEAEGAFAGLLEMQEDVLELNEKLGTLDADSEEFRQVLKRQGEIQHQLDSSEIYSMQAKIEKVLLGLGFKQDDMERSVTEFSGGWLMRLKLAKMLLEAPSLLLLDEPTNHLDLESLTWLEEFLRTYNGAMMIVSHDRMFLDSSTTATWEVSFGRVTAYKGNYSYYLKEKEERRTIERAAYDNQQAQIRQTMRFVDRFRAKSTKAKQVQSRLKQLDKLELIELADDEMTMKFSFPPAPASGRDVLQVEGLSKSYNGKQVFKDVNLQLQRGDKVAVVGVNGAGKSTLLKILSENIEKDSGEVRLGANVVLTYFGQHQAQELTPSLSVLDTMALAGEDMTITRMRSLLGAFLFRGEEVEKKVSVLSGGEKSRLALAKMIATPANLMLLDEPTNHLDMSSQEILQEAMGQYEGTIVVVSHNRYFVDSFVNKVLEVKDGRVSVFEGNVAEYLRKLEEVAEQEALKAAKRPVEQEEKTAQKSSDSSNLSRKEQKKLEAEKRQERSRLAGPWIKKVQEAEAKIEVLEEEKDELEAIMADPELYSDEKAWSETSKKYDECKRRLERWYGCWEEAQEKVEAVDAELQ